MEVPVNKTFWVRRSIPTQAAKALLPWSLAWSFAEVAVVRSQGEEQGGAAGPPRHLWGAELAPGHQGTEGGDTAGCREQLGAALGFAPELRGEPWAPAGLWDRAVGLSPLHPSERAGCAERGRASPSSGGGSSGAAGLTWASRVGLAQPGPHCCHPSTSSVPFPCSGSREMFFEEELMVWGGCRVGDDPSPD